jgi:hypothetical protein
MAGSPKVSITKYFGSSNINQGVFDLDEAKGQLEYFWTTEGSSNIVISVDGQQIRSFAELQALASQERYQNSKIINVGLFLSNDGTKSIWPARNN